MAFPVSDEIHLWLINENSVDDALLESYWPFLSPDERVRYDRLRQSGDRKRFLITRAAVRNTLSHYFPDVLPAQWQFSRNSWGRPVIATPTHSVGVEFSISHTRGLIAIAVAASGSLGVDVEYTVRRNRTLAIANRYFSSTEVEALQRLPAQAQRERFFDLWTLKEAYIKACGMGLAIPLRSFSFDFSAENIAIAFAAERDDEPQGWQFWQMAASPDHRLALAFKRAGETATMKVVCRALVPLRDSTCIELRQLGHGVQHL